jgi:hypothetical protein
MSIEDEQPIIPDPGQEINELDRDMLRDPVFSSEVLQVIEGEDFQQVCNLYSSASNQPESYHSAMAQYLEPSLFAELLQNEAVRKVVVRESGRMVGISLLTNEIGLSPILSPDYFNRLPDYGDKTTLMMTSVADPDSDHNEAIASELFRQTISHATKDNETGYITFVDTERHPSSFREGIENGSVTGLQLVNQAPEGETTMDQEACYLAQVIKQSNSELERAYTTRRVDGPITDESLIQTLWKLNQEVVAELAVESPFIQTYPFEYFVELMNSDTVTKYILADNQDILGYGLLTKKLENEPLLSDKTTKSSPYVESFGKTECSLIMFIGIAPAHRNQKSITELLGDMIASVGEKDTAMFLYSKKHNATIPRLASLMAKRRGGEVSGHDIDATNSYLYSWSKTEANGNPLNKQ